MTAQDKAKAAGDEPGKKKKEGARAMQSKREVHSF